MVPLTEGHDASIAEFVPELDRLAVDVMADWKVPGAALAVVQDGKLALAKAYGQRDVEANLAVTPTTQFVIGSITKSFTATGVALLHDEGRLDWTKPVRDYIPEFRLNDSVATERVTVQDLLCHQSGLPRHDWVHLPGDRSGRRIARRHALSRIEPGYPGGLPIQQPLLQRRWSPHRTRQRTRLWGLHARAPDRPAWHEGQLHPGRS